ncbi:MAG: hypothetical protein WD734_00105, partial [Dehalococcoidia bacterium]
LEVHYLDEATATDDPVTVPAEPRPEETPSSSRMGLVRRLRATDRHGGLQALPRLGLALLLATDGVSAPRRYLRR